MRKALIRGAAVLLALTLTGALVAACSGSDSQDLGSADAEAGDTVGVEPADGGDRAAMPESEGAVDEALGSGEGGSGSAFSPVSLPGAGPNVIKEASLDIEVQEKGFQDAIIEAVRIAERTGGFVLTNSIDDAKRRRGRLVLRIPANEFESAVAALGGLGEVQAQEVSGIDVSEEFVDLEARLRNLEAQETVLLRLMDRARSVSDTIKVQRELTGIQLEIEQIHGRLRFLEDRTSFGTISMAVTEAGVTIADAGPLSEAWSRALEGAAAVVAGVIVAAGYSIPLGVIVLILVGALRVLIPRFRTT